MARWHYRSALVTGASSGIGEAMTRQLAARGCDLVIAARRERRLRDLAAELMAEHQISIEVLPADLATPEGVEQVARRLRDDTAPVELLVNNAGHAPQPIGPLAGQDPAVEARKVAVNVTALTLLTQAALPGMQERRHGGILNVSSFSSFVPQPSGAVYAATKAYVTSFGESMHAEVARYGVHVTTLAPGFTRRGDGAERGGMKQRRMPEALWLDRDEVAIQALDAVADGTVLCVPGLPYKALALFARIAPRSMVRRGFELLWAAPARDRQRPAADVRRSGTDLRIDRRR